jgi:hypothetical protein
VGKEAQQAKSVVKANIPVRVVMCNGTTHDLGKFAPNDSILSVKQALEALSGTAVGDTQLHLTDDKRPDTQDLGLTDREILTNVSRFATSGTELLLGAVLQPVSSWSSTAIDLQAGVASALKGNVDAALQFYEEAADDVRSLVHSLDKYCAHAHFEDSLPQLEGGWNEVSSYRVISEESCACFPAAGKSHVPPLTLTKYKHELFPYVGIPTNGREIAMHPPSDGNSLAAGGFIVCAFVCPVPGTYTITDVAIKSVVRDTQGPVLLQVFADQMLTGGTLDQVDREAGNQAPVLASSTSYPVQHLDWIPVSCPSPENQRPAPEEMKVEMEQGSRIYFAVIARDGGFACGAVRIKWSISHRVE